MNFKRYFQVTFGGIIILLLLIIGVVVVIDPYQQYRKSDIFISNQRLENPGVAKHHDYDAVIVGSSMSMNHYPSQVDSLYGWNTINLTITGCTDFDYCLLLPFLTMHKKMKHMVWGIDFFSFFYSSTSSFSEIYLYDNTWMNDFSYWINYTSLKKSLYKLQNKTIISRDSIYHFSPPCGKNYLLQSYELNNNEDYLGEYDFTQMNTRFDKMMESLMPIMGNIEMYVYFPPYSILEFKMFEQYGHWEQILDFKQHMIEELLKYSNVELYDFQNEEFICNLDEYMDLRHHSHAYNKRIIEYIHKDSCRVRAAEYENDLMTLDSVVRHYELPMGN